MSHWRFCWAAVASFISLGFLCDSAQASERHHAPCPPDAFVDGLPFVQCDRSPPCVRWNWATPARCARMRLDSQWPTWDPYIARHHDWKSMSDLLRDHVRGKTLMFVGDSITNLFYHGFTCEAARHGLTVTENHPRLTDFVSRFQAIPRDRWVGENGAPHLYTYVVETDSIISMKGWAKSSVSDTAAFLELCDVCVVNYGLHYNNQTEYEQSMNDVFSQLQTFNRQTGRKAVFREISAQAFEGSGAYSPGADKRTTSDCAPTPPEAAYDNFVSRQNALLHRLSSEYGVPVLEFYNTTLKRWDMREARFCQYEGRRNDPNSVCLDCTHLCATPTLWASEVNKLFHAFN